MEREQVIKALIEAAAQTEDGPAFEESVGETLWAHAEREFGDWTSALAAALVEAARGKRRSSTRRTSGVADVERKITEAFEHPVYVETLDQKLYGIPGSELSVSDQVPPVDEGTLSEGIGALHYVGDSDAVYLFSNQGRFFGLNSQLVPTWDRRDQRRSIRDLLFLEPDEAIRAVVPRRRLVAGRLIHITRGGKGKASDASELGSGLDRSGRQAFKVRDGDDVAAVMGVDRDTTVFCASAKGKGIHFEADEMRTMGLVAVGVNVIKLDGDDDAVIGAFEGKRVRQIAVISEQGLGKRVDFSEFRTQGRAGQGMQLARLNPGDLLAGAVPCNPAEDLAITTSRGRVWRVPAAQFHMMGRPAKGNPVAELSGDERVVHLAALPCGG